MDQQGGQQMPPPPPPPPAGGPPPPPPPGGPPPPPPNWQSTPQQPGQPPMGAGQPNQGMPAWTNNITARGGIAGPGGLTLADVPERIIALIIDGLILWVIGLVINLVLGTVLVETRTDIVFGVPITTRGPSLLAGVVGLVAYVVISAGYYIYMWSRMNGQTIGMRVLKLSVRDEATGGQITQGQAINRWLLLGGPQALYFIPILNLIAWIVLLVYYIYLLISTAQSPTRQGLHDKYAKTVVAKLAM